MAGFSILTSQTLNFLSRQVVTRRAPLALQDSDCMTSPCFRANRSLLCSMSHSFTVKSPEALAKTFAADGLNRTWPTFLRRRQTEQRHQDVRYLEWPASLPTGGMSLGSSASV